MIIGVDYFAAPGNGAQYTHILENRRFAKIFSEIYSHFYKANLFHIEVQMIKFYQSSLHVLNFTELLK